MKLDYMKKILLSVFALSILLPTLAFASFSESLKYGSRGDAVVELQDLLVAQGFLNGKVDGRYGLVTVNAVKAFQTANGLSSDGFFGKASRTKASLILTDQLQSSNTAEQAETGATATISTVAGCTSTSAYSATTGQPCNSTTQPTTLNLPAGCTSTSGFSITTGQACNGITSTIQQLQQTVQQIQQNTQQLVQNTTPKDLCLNIEGVQTYVPSGMTINSSNNCVVSATPQSMKDLIITPLATRDGWNPEWTRCKHFNINILDDNGKSLETPFPIKMVSSDFPNNRAIFGGGGDKNEITYCIPEDKSSIDLTFSYEPLNLTKTITVTTKDTTAPVVKSLSWIVGNNSLEVNTDKPTKAKVSFYTFESAPLQDTTYSVKDNVKGLNFDQIKTKLNNGDLDAEIITSTDDNFSTNHMIVPVGLIKGLHYDVKVEVTDQLGNTNNDKNAINDNNWKPSFYLYN